LTCISTMTAAADLTCQADNVNDREGKIP
jgi:hypothetical protein